MEQRVRFPGRIAVFVFIKARPRGLGRKQSIYLDLHFSGQVLCDDRSWKFAQIVKCSREPPAAKKFSRCEQRMDSAGGVAAK